MKEAEEETKKPRETKPELVDYYRRIKGKRRRRLRLAIDVENSETGLVIVD